MRRVWARMTPTVNSATAVAFRPGAFTTLMPRSDAALRSILTGPPRATAARYALRLDRTSLRELAALGFRPIISFRSGTSYESSLFGRGAFAPVRPRDEVPHASAEIPSDRAARTLPAPTPPPVPASGP